MQIVSGLVDESVLVWDVSRGAEAKVTKGHTNRIAFSSDSTQISSGGSIQPYSSVNSGWNLADNNWIISSQGKELLMWVPPAARVTEPSNILAISRHGSGSVDFQRSMLGVHWARCYDNYTPPKPNV
ncbi:hypothetical protein FPV67DRAFT_743666 [Lyophyllum atratum]|nr:hypothetical protein FPV67DRAFT_743666 [Lyophyllum atratum]